MAKIKRGDFYFFVMCGWLCATHNLCTLLKIMKLRYPVMKACSFVLFAIKCALCLRRKHAENVCNFIHSLGKDNVWRHKTCSILYIQRM